MRTPERPLSRFLPLLFCAAVAGCGGEGKQSLSVAAGGSAVADPAAPTKPSAFAPPKAEPGPGEEGYVSPPSTKQTPPLIQATVKGNLDAVKALLDGGSDPSVAREGGLTALHIAVGDNKMEIFKALVDKGADTGAKQEAGATPLHIAAQVPHGLEYARLLLEHKADVNAKDKKDQTPLIVAGSRGNTDTVELLLANGADVNAQGRDGASALGGAVRFDHKELVAVLLASGANANVADGQKNTPLHYAARTGNREISELLLANGADILAKSEEGGTAFQLAVYMEHEELAKYLQELEKAAGGAGAEPTGMPEKPTQLPGGKPKGKQPPPKKK
jgi:ankyrin repeat protein